jgi:hypothetical protein
MTPIWYTTIRAIWVQDGYACAISDPCAHTPVTIQPLPQGRAHPPPEENTVTIERVLGIAILAILVVALLVILF